MRHCVGALLAVLAGGQALAQDATWLSNPASGDFSSAANWSPATVPTGIATFGATDTANVIFSASAALDALQFAAGGPAYTFSLGAGITVDLNGPGIIDASSNTQTFDVSGTLNFNNSATAGSARYIVNAGGVIDTSQFVDPSIDLGSIEGSGSLYVGAHGVVIGANNRSTTFSGVISDCGPTGNECANAGVSGGGIGKTGTGTLTLSGANIYTNGTLISQGTLEAAHATAGIIDALGTGTIGFDGGTLRATVNGELQNDLDFGPGKSSTLSVAAGNTVTLTGEIRGRNNSTMVFGTAADTGTIVFDAFPSPFFSPNSRIVIGGGTLVVGPSNAFGFITPFIASTEVKAGATLDINDQFVVINNLIGAGNVRLGVDPLTQFGVFLDGTKEFSGVISGPGGVQFGTFGPSATMILSGNNTYTGNTFVCECTTLQIGNGGTSGAIAGDITNGGTVAFNRSDAYVYRGVISDDVGFSAGTVRQIGTGNTILTGIHQYTGPTFVDAGTLSVDGSIATSSGVTVASGATLGGTGIVPTTSIDGGTLAPGNSIGTLTVQGNLGFTSASFYRVELSPTDSDRTNVTGTASLAGTLSLQFASGGYSKRRYTILSASGGRTGEFGTVVTDAGPGLAANVSYTSTDVLLDLSAVLGNGAILSRNQSQVADVINGYFNAGNALPSGFFTLFNLSGVSLGNALTQLSGEGATGAPYAAFQTMTQFMSQLGERAGEGSGDPPAPALGYAGESTRSTPAREAFAAVKPRDIARRPSGWSVWAAPFGGSGRVSGESVVVGSSDRTTQSYGLAAGADYRFGQGTIAGIAAGGAGERWGVGGASGRGDVALFGVHARHDAGAFYISAIASYAWHRFHTDRTVSVAGIDRLEADATAHAFAGRFEAGHRFGTAFAGITPYAAVTGQTARLPAYAERATSGAATFALNYAARDAGLVRTELGGKVDYRVMATQESNLLLKARAAWAYDSASDPSVTASFQTLPGSAFAVAGAASARHLALLSLGADVLVNNSLTIGIVADSELSSRGSSLAGRASLRYQW